MSEMFVEKLYNNMMELYGDENKGTYFKEGIPLPITKIDNVNVHVVIAYYKNLLLTLTIESEHGYMYNDNNNYDNINLYYIRCDLFIKEGDMQIGDLELTKENLKIEFDKMMDELEIIKFDKLLNRFVKNPGMYDFLKNRKNITVGESCCVCFETTTYKTHCFHSICVPCLTEIKFCEELNDDNEMDNIIKCPICRSKLA